MFDKLLLLANGKQVYFGSPKKVVPYFAKLGYECPEYQNPADYVLNLITSGYELERGGKKIPSKQITEELIEAYQTHSNKNTLTPTSSTSLNLVKLEEGESIVPPSEFSRFAILVERGIKATLRNPAATIAKLFQAIIFSILFGLVYLKIGDTQVDIRNRLGALYFIVVFVLF